MRRFVVCALIMVSMCAGTVPSAKAACPANTDCDMATRIAAADEYLATRPGSVGYVLRDRASGTVYRNAHAQTPVWTASTIKLAMVVDLLSRDRAGAISLDESDRALMAAMLHVSDDDAADTLWTRFGGADHQAFNNDFPSYGLTGLQPQRGFSTIYPYWGFQKATPDDLDRLMNYTLTELDPADSAEIVDALQHVGANQQWGVWGAGPDMEPGNKDGWSLEQGGWVVNTVGFAGPRQRYTLAIMNSLGEQGGYADGVSTTTRLSELLLAGRR